MKEIITDIESLYTRAEEIDVKKENDLMREIILALKEVVRNNNLSTLAAPQIGYAKRIFVINFNGDVRTFINPTITEATGFDLSKEQCPSLPGKTFMRIRNNKINVIYQTPLGKINSQTLLGVAATTFQRSLDVLEGIFLNDIGVEIPQDFEQQTEEQRVAFVNNYLDALDIKLKEVTKEIDENPELKQMQNAVNFIEGVQKGEIQLSEKKIAVNKEGNIIE